MNEAAGRGRRFAYYAPHVMPPVAGVPVTVQVMVKGSLDAVTRGLAIMNRLMRGVGPISDVAPEFPLAAATLAPLRAKSEMAGSADFSPLWSGQAAGLGRELPAAELTKRLAAEALENLRLLQAAV